MVIDSFLSGSSRARASFFDARSPEYRGQMHHRSIWKWLPGISIATFFMSMSAAAFADANHDWMADNWEAIKDQYLSELVIPGTHDAGTYDLSFGDSAWADSTKQALNDLIPSIAQGYATTQSQTIYEQLMSGARILDLRFEEVQFLGIQDYRIHHSYLGPSYTEIFADIKQFLEESGHEKEIIVLRFNSMQSAVNVKSDGTFSRNMTTSDHQQFMLKILEEFGEYMVPETYTEDPGAPRMSNGFARTPKEITVAGKQVIVLYGASWKSSYNDDYSDYAWGNWIAKNKLNTLAVADNPALSWCLKEGALHCEDLFWENAESNGWFKTTIGGYGNPSLYDSVDKLQNLWLRGAYKDSIFEARTDETWATTNSIAMGLDTPGEPVAGIPFMIFNNLITGELSFDSLESAAAYTNPRLVPHLIALPKTRVNFVLVDYLQSSGLVEEAIKLNANPARVSVRVKSVQLTREIDQCGPGSGFLGIADDDCDMYPNLAISEGTEIDEVGDQTENYQIAILDRNNIYRGSHFSAPRWSTTTAVPWESAENLTFRIQIWDDDYPLGEDGLETVTHVFQPGYLANIKEFENSCDEEFDIVVDEDDPILNTEKYSVVAGGRVRVTYDYVVQDWSSEGCSFGAEWSTPGDMRIGTDPGVAFAVVDFEVSPPAYSGWEVIQLSCFPVSGSEFAVGSTLVTCSAEYRRELDDGGFETRVEDTSFTVTIFDDEKPVITPPPSVNREATGLMSIIDIGTASAIDNVDGMIAATSNAPDAFPLGTTIVTWTATDEAGNTGTAEQSITVVDTTPPTINSLSVTPSVLWPPNKTMRPVSITIDAQDLVDDSPICEITNIQVNQAAARGSKRATLYEITGPHSASLLADRTRSRGDRRYTLHVTCTDFEGNASNGSTDVVVPHDRRIFGKRRIFEIAGKSRFGPRASSPRR
jgi:hypothetical protein